MKRRSIKAFQRGRYIFLSIVFAIIGLFIGIGSGYARPYANINGTHLETVIEFFFIMPILCLIAVLTYLRIRYKQAVLALSGQLTLLWMSNITGKFIISLVQYPLLDDLIGLTLIFWLGSIVLAALLLGGIRKVWPLRYASTDCPNCGYSLKGLGTSGACPECGQPFTAASLGVSEAELQAEV